MPDVPRTLSPTRGAASLLVEALLVILAGAAFALAANRISPRGLALGRDYFPPASIPTAVPAANTLAVARGLQVIDGPRIGQLFRDPGYQSGAIVFVDAREDQHYRERHIPGAYAFDRYHPEQHLLSVVPACMAAQQIVVYCSGGTCEDSVFAALMLRDAGIPAEKLFVYVGGITEWMAAKLPVETGPRGSGNLQEHAP
jgi:rhodanese-related sulfurtransferase